jgi:Pyruvate/2-oxoacid:ferredoxin oxidoreductase delta subunit
MCQFCVEHGEGKRWYLNAKNYSYDLQSDVRRREYIHDFISGFDEMRANAVSGMELLGKLPTPIERATKSVLSKRQQEHHFGQPVPIEECAQILDIATSVTVIPCICRMHAPGQRADEVCMLVTTQPIEPYITDGFKDYAAGPDLDDFHRVEKAEAMQLLRECEGNGLMHSIWTFQTPFAAAICNCNLESGCMAMRLTKSYEMKVMWRGEWVAVADAEKCTSCGRCAKACPFDAIEKTEMQTFAPRAEDCWGCGVCRAHCSQDALQLVDRRSVPAVAALW